MVGLLVIFVWVGILFLFRDLFDCCLLRFIGFVVVIAVVRWLAGCGLDKLCC